VGSDQVRGSSYHLDRTISILGENATLICTCQEMLLSSPLFEVESDVVKCIMLA
jgi:hypothetical protein